MPFTVTEKTAGTFESITPAGATFEAVLDMTDIQSDYIAFLFNYTQDASGQVAFGFEMLEDGDYYKETIVDAASIAPFEPILTAAGKYRVIIPVYRATDKLKIVITPDALGGNDTFIIDARNAYNANY